MASKAEAASLRKFGIAGKLAYAAGDFDCSMSFGLKSCSGWKFGERSEGTNYALHAFFRKLAQGVFPSLGILLAAWLGCNAAQGADRPMAVASNMRCPVAAPYLLTAVLTLVFVGGMYNLDKKHGRRDR